ncbi:MAG: hypothetical protein IV107_16400 [Paucibacter sp.]|nr:hypothetical protein [Roseateles sp.]
MSQPTKPQPADNIYAAVLRQAEARRENSPQRIAEQVARIQAKAHDATRR